MIRRSFIRLVTALFVLAPLASTVAVSQLFQFHAPTLGTTTITDATGGLDIVLVGSPTVGQHVDGTYYVIADGSGNVTFDSYTLSAGVTSQKVLSTRIWVDPSTPDKQPFDTRVDINSRGPGNTYDNTIAGAFTLPQTINVTGTTAKSVVFYRGLDTVQNGGASTGAHRLVVITVYPSSPGVNVIKPATTFVAGGKPVYTRADINFNKYAPITIPSGATEPNWNTPGNFYLTTPLWTFGTTVNNAFIYPQTAGAIEGTQESFNNGFQGAAIGRLILGAISNSASRQTLIERIVREGLEIDAHVRLGGVTAHIGNGGFGVQRKVLRYLAGKYLNEVSMLGTPATIFYSSANRNVGYFHEDGTVFAGATRALYGTMNLSTWPTQPFDVFNNTERDGTGVGTGTREAFWIMNRAGTAQSATEFSIRLAAGTTGINLTDRVYIDGGTGSGQDVQVITAWNNTTKDAEIASPYTTNGTGTATGGSASTIVLAAVPADAPTGTAFGNATGPFSFVTITSGTGSGQTRLVTGFATLTATVSPNWTTPPNATSVYATRQGWVNHLWTVQPNATSTFQTYNGGGYQADVTRGGMVQTAAALVLIGEAGDTADWAPQFFAYTKRFIVEDDAFLVPRYPPAFLTSYTNDSVRRFWDSSNWTQLWWNEAVAIWP